MFQKMQKTEKQQNVKTLGKTISIKRNEAKNVDKAFVTLKQGLPLFLILFFLRIRNYNAVWAPKELKPVLLTFSGVENLWLTSALEWLFWYPNKGEDRFDAIW